MASRWCVTGGRITPFAGTWARRSPCGTMPDREAPLLMPMIAVSVRDMHRPRVKMDSGSASRACTRTSQSPFISNAPSPHPVQKIAPSDGRKRQISSHTRRGTKMNFNPDKSGTFASHDSVDRILEIAGCLADGYRGRCWDEMSSFCYVW